VPTGGNVVLWQRTGLALAVPLVAIGALWAADLGWAAHSGLRVVGITALAGTLLLLAANFWFYRGRVEADRARDLVSGFAWFFALAAGTAFMSYLAATLDRPLADPWLARADAALGFDWLAWFGAVQANHALQGMLHFAYGSMMLQVMVDLFVLPLSGMGTRNRELLSAFAISMIPTLILFALFPAACPWVFLHAEPNKVALHMLDLQALRTGHYPVLDLQRIHGLVTFPSYHTVVAILLIWAARGTRGFFLALVLNLLMLASVPSKGGHYLVDMLAGATIAFVTIALVRRYGGWLTAA
jgi:hypothetical protein